MIIILRGGSFPEGHSKSDKALNLFIVYYLFINSGFSPEIKRQYKTNGSLEIALKANQITIKQTVLLIVKHAPHKQNITPLQ